MSAIPCADVDALLSDWLADAAEPEVLDQHLAACAACREQARVRFLQDRRLAEVGLGSALGARVHEALARESAGSPWRRAGLAAAILILAGVFSAILLRKENSTPARPATPVNLLALVDPARDAVSGAWTLDAGGLVSDRAASARIEIPYRPPEEYDFRAVFTRRAGNDAVTQVCSHSGKSFAWVMGLRNNQAAGFELIGWLRADNNRTTVRSEEFLRTGVRHESVVQVRRDGFRAYLDGKLMAEWKTGYRDLRTFDHWKLRDDALLGLASWDSATIFHQVEILEVTGTGVRTR
jgi:hypothetical protein